MFTLKVANTGSAPESVTWIGDVSAVHLLGVSTKERMRDAWSGYFDPNSRVNDLTGWLTPDRDVALLTVIYANGFDEYVLCGRAWLLSDAGNTIERITP